MIDIHKTYMLEVKRTYIRDILRSLDKYTCQMVTAEDGSECYLEFFHKDSRESHRFSLEDIQSTHRMTKIFIDEEPEVTLSDQVDKHCFLYQKEAQSGLKRNRQAIAEQMNEEDDEDDLIFNDHLRDKESFKGNVSHIADQRKRVRYSILKILAQTPEGNISPSEMRDQLKKRQDMQIPESYARKTMEELCEPTTERNNRKYILKSEYKSPEGDSSIRKKQKQA